MIKAMISKDKTIMDMDTKEIWASTSSMGSKSTNTMVIITVTNIMETNSTIKTGTRQDIKTTNFNKIIWDTAKISKITATTKMELRTKETSNCTILKTKVVTTKTTGVDITK